MPEWRGNEIALRRPDDHALVRVPAPLITFLAGLSGWRPAADAAKAAELPDDIVAKLAAVRLLQTSSCVASAPPLPQHRLAGGWDPWGEAAWAFHRSTADVTYVIEKEAKAARAAEVTAQPPPPQWKTYPGHTEIPFSPGPFPPVSLAQCLQSRRTIREFTSAVVEQSSVATLLDAAFGIQGTKDAGPYGRLPVKFSPAAGARHEAEAYLICRRVAGISPGQYYYHPARRTLVRLGEIEEDRLAEATFDQPCCSAAAALVLTTAVLSRLSYKYRHPRAYRLWQYDVGHIGQTFALTATALELGYFQTAAFHDTRVAALLHLPDDEIPTYILGVGIPAETPEIWPLSA